MCFALFTLVIESWLATLIFLSESCILWIAILNLFLKKGEGNEFSHDMCVQKCPQLSWTEEPQFKDTHDC